MRAVGDMQGSMSAALAMPAGADASKQTGEKWHRITPGVPDQVVLSNHAFEGGLVGHCRLAPTHGIEVRTAASGKPAVP